MMIAQLGRCRFASGLLLTALALPLWPAAVRAGNAKDEPKKVALLVGVNRYRSRILADQPLRYAERDVEELEAVLKKQEFNVQLLTGPNATKAKTDAALDAALNGRAAEDVVLIAFAGHGVQMLLIDEQGKPVLDDRGKELSDGYFCPVDAVYGKTSTLISLTRLFERLNREAGIKLLLVDACRNNPEAAAKRGFRALSGNALNGRMPQNSAILFSCAADQIARETADAGGGHGVFFHHVIEGLKGAAADPETREVGWEDLARYVRRNVDRSARAWFPEEAARNGDRALQTPHMLGNLVAAPVLARFNSRPNSPIVGPAPKTITNKAGMTLALIPAGEFLMGSPGDHKDAENDERPQHRVRITQPFYVGATEVTIGQFRTVVESANLRTRAEIDGEGGWGWNEAARKFEGRDPKYTWRFTGWEQSDEHPVVNVTWDDAIAFCNALSRYEGVESYYRFGEGVRSGGDGYRLPTEAEWEYACRAGTTTRYTSGDDPETLVGVGNIADATLKSKGGPFAHWPALNGRDGYIFTAPVGRFRPNAFGLFDMHGNVWEWCWDWYDADYYRASPIDDPSGPARASYRVLRGGCWGSSPRDARAALRLGYAPDVRYDGLGFRVARGRSGLK
jgi:formylglycine-generating enzyme required for sulfatase activity